jgi:hypothetical protein
MEHEPYGELALVSPDGHIVHHLDWRTTSPSPAQERDVVDGAPGFMTGPGTNSYLWAIRTGLPRDRSWPNEPEHLQRIWRECGGDIRMIVCTHSHPDHSPGARPLQAQCASRPPILGLPSAPTARAASEFTPDRALRDGEQLMLEGDGLRHSLKSSIRPAMRPTISAWSWWKTACCSRATLSSTAAPRWSIRPMAT